MRRDGGGIDDRFADYVRARGEHLLRVAVLLTGDWHAAEDLVQAAFVRAYVVRHCRLRVEALVANREISWLDADRIGDIRKSRRAIREILVGILTEGLEKGAFDPPQIDGKRDLKAVAMALLDQWTHVSMWYGPGGRLSEEQMARLYAEMALRGVGAKA